MAYTFNNRDTQFFPTFAAYAAESGLLTIIKYLGCDWKKETC